MYLIIQNGQNDLKNGLLLSGCELRRLSSDAEINTFWRGLDAKELFVTRRDGSGQKTPIAILSNEEFSPKLIIFGKRNP